jgi:hypothetical protein
MRRKSALIATSLTLVGSLVAGPAAMAQGGPGGGGGTSGGGGGGTSGGGGGGGGRSAQCGVVSFDPVTGINTVVCTTLRA